MSASQSTEPTPEKVEQLAQQIGLLIQFSASLVDDLDILEKVAQQSAEISSNALTLAPVLGAVGADYSEAHMEAEVKRKRANAIVNLVRVLKETESDREDFKAKKANNQKVLAQLRGMGLTL